jgi:hypothetical protein
MLSTTAPRSLHCHFEEPGRSLVLGSAMFPQYTAQVSRTSPRSMWLQRHSTKRHSACSICQREPPPVHESLLGEDHTASLKQRAQCQPAKAILDQDPLGLMECQGV